MTLERMQRITRGLKRPVICAISALTLFGGVLAATVQADPADDAMAKLNELSRQAERTTEAMHSAQLDLNNKLAAEQDAEAKQEAKQGRAKLFSVSQFWVRPKLAYLRAFCGLAVDRYNK